MRFKKKPVVIEAVQFTGTNHGEIFAFCPAASNNTGEGPSGQGVSNTLWIETLEGGHVASRGDFIIKGVKGEFYPCKPDIFAATYDPVPNECSG